MSFSCQEFSSASNMEVDEQSQPQLKDPSTSQIARSTKTPKQECQESILYANVPNNGDHHQDNPTPRKIVEDEANNIEVVDQEFFNHLPPGYRFNPTDVELILHYLKPKTENKRLPRNQIRHVNLYQYSPSEITARYKELTEREWYFFTPRDRKYRNGNRPNRAAGTGYWKATGADKSIVHNGDEIGFRKALVYYEGKPPRGEKTSWIMHEYRVKEATPKKKRRSEIDMRLDDYILCRIYKKSDKLLKSQHRGEAQGQYLQDDEDPSTSREQNGGSSAYKNDELMNAYGEFSHVMDAPVPLPEHFHSQQPQQPPMDKRARPVHFAPPTNFAPLVYPAENLSGDQNIWSLPGVKAQELSEFDFPYVGLPELDNIYTSIYPSTDDPSMPNLDNPSLPKKFDSSKNL